MSGRVYKLPRKARGRTHFLESTAFGLAPDLQPYYGSAPVILSKANVPTRQNCPKPRRSFHSCHRVSSFAPYHQGSQTKLDICRVTILFSAEILSPAIPLAGIHPLRS